MRESDEFTALPSDSSRDGSRRPVRVGLEIGWPERNGGGVAMTWPRLVGLLIVALGASGCATSAHRVTSGPHGSRLARTRVIAPRQTQETLSADEADLFEANPASRTETSAMNRYFPGLARSTPSPTPVVETGVIKTNLPSKAETTTSTLLEAKSWRPNWFGLRKSKTSPRTYLTDARSATSPSAALPTMLPVALQIPSPRTADRAVTTTSGAELESGVDAVEAKPKTREPVPSNPDASDAEALPLDKTEPQLAIDPIDQFVSKRNRANPAVESKLAPTEPVAPQPSIDSAEEFDPRGRPRLAPTVSAAPARTAEATPDELPATAPTQPAVTRPESSPTDAKTVRATPSAADPMGSLGLPQAMLPASYTKHDSIAIRGTQQTPPQPPPVLASPQVEPSSQSSRVVSAQAVKVWSHPICRLMRRMGKTGEFASPPTAKPH